MPVPISLLTDTVPAQPIRVILVDDHAAIRRVLRQVLQPLTDCQVIGEAENGEQALQMISGQMVDLVLLDVEMPGLSGVPLVRRMHAVSPATSIIMLSMHAGKAVYQPFFEAGAIGYLLKGSGLSRLKQAMAKVMGGQRYVDEALCLA